MMLLVGRTISDRSQVAEVSFAEFMDYKRKNQIKSIEIDGDNIIAKMHEGFSIGHSAAKTMHTKLPPSHKEEQDGCP